MTRIIKLAHLRAGVAKAVAWGEALGRAAQPGPESRGCRLMVRRSATNRVDPPR